jgi:predicted nucleotidyltransferase
MNPPTDDLMGDIVRRIVETAQPDKIILVGSRARGDARPDSDFDVLVIKESSEPGYRRDALLYLALVGLNAQVDVMVYTPEEVADWSAVPQAFVTTALREGKVVYEKKADMVSGWLRKATSDMVTPTLETAKQADASALTVRDFVLRRLPKEIVDAAKQCPSTASSITA